MRFMILAALLLAGCTTYEDVPIDDTRDGILIANAELRAANLLLQDVIRSGAISREDAQRAKGHLAETHQALVTALNAIDLHGDVLTAEDRLEQAIGALDIALSLLAPHTAPPQAAVTHELLEAA